MEDEKREEVVEQEPTQEPETQAQVPEPKTDLSAVLEAIAELKQIVQTALTQVEPETVATEVEEVEDETHEDIPHQDVDEIAEKLGF